MALEDFVTRIKDKRTLWATSERRFSADDIYEKVTELRKNKFISRNARVVVACEDPVECILWMIALDNRVDSAFLVPASLKSNADDYQRLINEFQYTHIIQDEIEQNVEKELTGENAFISTRWVIATSGTTGIPKLISHTTETLTKTSKHDTDRGKDFIWGLVYDPLRFAGLQVVLQSLASGSCLVFLNVNAAIKHQAIEMVEHRVNALSATPSYWRKLLMSAELKKHEFKQITLGGEPTDQAVLTALKSNFPSSRIAHIYASTEAGVGFSVTDGLAGFPLDYITDGVNGNRIKIGLNGTLLIKPNGFVPEMVNGACLQDDDGYIDTGDLVEQTADRVFFLGRDSGAINVGGNKVIPEEVESVIRSVPGVEEALVKAKRSGMMGSLVVADVRACSYIADTTTLKTEIIIRCKAELDSYKVPVMIRFVEEIASNSAGKVLRN
ncbi:AMP-binding protein [Pseudidiomarina salinarum]|uniref:AMP-binding protein n=1 Tax=Pseudidiomarina salinarum TaxID=435908 RepID=UPI000689A70F|nr:AMP-binding protein [Pseudidiomarina salinarum]RUO70883.1 long-chain fatty acid--CoA ligase [Pseudidiomarina salinarum]